MNPTVVWLPRANTELLYLCIANLTDDVKICRLAALADGLLIWAATA